MLTSEARTYWSAVARVVHVAQDRSNLDVDICGGQNNDSSWDRRRGAGEASLQDVHRLYE